MNLRYWSVGDIRSAVINQSVSAEDFVHATQKSLDTIGRALDAVVFLAPKESIHQAQQAERLSRNKARPTLALAGVPLAHKELYLRQGWPCDAGSQSMAGYHADRTTWTLRRLDQAGAVDCGRLDTVELALGTTGHNDYNGTPRNPWNPDYICGGSSSGSAAVVAAGLVPASMGSDTGGSIRLPAAACGLVGIKPTHGLVGRSGIFALSATLDCAGPLTRSVRDGALMLNVLAGFDPDDPASIERPPVDHLADIESGLAGVRVGWPVNHFFEDADAEVADAISDVFQLCGKLGAQCKDVSMPGIESANAMTMLLIAVESFTLHQRIILDKPDKLGPQTLARLLVGAHIPARDYCAALAARASMARRVLEETFSRVDVVVTPVWPYPIPTIRESDVGANEGAAEMVQRSGHNTRPVNYLGFPALTLPIGLDRNGLPLSVQLIGRPFSEPTLLRAARALERELDFWSRRPDLSWINPPAEPSRAV